MDDFENMKQIWNSKNNLNIPEIIDIQNIIKRYQNKKRRNAFLLTVSFIICGLLFILIVLFYQYQLWTTIFGEALILIGFILGLMLKVNTLKSVNKSIMKSNKVFLEYLSKVTAERKTKVNWLQLVSVFLLTIGYGFFIYEEIKDNKTEFILVYSGMLVFVLSMYFIFRPMMKRNSKNKIQKMLNEIESLK